jgi:hypothetical protein
MQKLTIIQEHARLAVLMVFEESLARFEHDILEETYNAFFKVESSDDLFQRDKKMRDFFVEIAYKESSLNHWENDDHDEPLKSKLAESSARGIFQLTIAAEKDSNEVYKTNFTRLVPEDNCKLAFIYLFIVIPKYLKHYGKDINTSNIALAYRWGAASSKIPLSKSNPVLSDEFDNATSELANALGKKNNSLVILSLIIIILTAVVKYLSGEVKSLN